MAVEVMKARRAQKVTKAVEARRACKGISRFAASRKPRLSLQTGLPIRYSINNDASAIKDLSTTESIIKAVIPRTQERCTHFPFR